MRDAATRSPTQRYATTISPLLDTTAKRFAASVYATGDDETWALERIWTCEHRHRTISATSACGARRIRELRRA